MTQRSSATRGVTGNMAGLDRAVMVLEVLERRGDQSLAEVARGAGLSDPTTLRYLTGLQAHGLVERDPMSGRFSLGVRLFQLGQTALRGRNPRAIALPVMRDLQAMFGETVSLAMRHRDDLILVEALVATHSLGKGATVGERDPWHSTSLGKAILSHLPEDEARAILANAPRDRFTGRTMTDVDMIMSDLARTRERGYAVDDEESEEGLRCIGAAIANHEAVFDFAVSVSGPEHRFRTSKMAEIGDAVAAAAASISTQLGFRAPRVDIDGSLPATV